MRFRTLLTVTTTAGLVAVTAGCSSGPAADSAVVNSATYVELYKETVSDFPEPLPDGVRFPSDPPPMEGDIGRGNAAGAAYFFWVCSWEDVYLRGDDRAETAMEHLRAFPTTAWGSQYLEDPENGWGGVLDAAELGDLTELRSFFQSDCEFYRSESSG